MRLSYVTKPPRLDNEADSAIVARMQHRRGERGLLPLDLALLHSPPIADGWNSFLGAIRNGTSLPASIRETAICRIAALNRAWFEWVQHVPILRACEGVREEAIDYILHAPPHGRSDGRYEAVHSLDEAHLAVLAYTDAMTLDVAVPEAVFARLRLCFGEIEVVEITATVAAYNCVSRFLVALDVGEQNGSEETDRR